MSSYAISVDLAGIEGIEEVLEDSLMPNLSAAVQGVADITAYRWRDSVKKAKLWEGEKQAYISTIVWKMLSGLEAVVESDYKNADEIENGRPARDLKVMLRTSLKVRVNKQGQRYLIIPFRHNTPGNSAFAPEMPPDVYAAAKGLTPSKVLGKYARPSGTGAYDIRSRQLLTVPANVYKWGGRLPAGLAPKLQTKHKTDPYAGMVRFNTSAGKGKSSAYLTFRVMKEGSPGWVIAARPGLRLAGKVADGMQPEAEEIFGKAVEMAVKSA
jgi:hypothetical protein